MPNKQANASTKKPKAQKRILEVSIHHMVDTSPDTSWLGEYSDRQENEFAIDRAHNADCASLEANHKTAVDQLERIISHLNEWRTSPEVADNPDNTEWEALDNSIDAMVALQDELMACDCSGPGDDWNRREYRYFNPGSVEPFKLDASWIPATITDPKERRAYWLDAMRKNAKQDYERMESLNDGHWCFMGIRAEAEIIANVTIDGPGKWHDTTQKISSGGLWGIESDSKEYIKEVEQEQLAELKTQLVSLGFSRRTIAKAFEDIKEVSE